MGNLKCREEMSSWTPVVLLVFAEIVVGSMEEGAMDVWVAGLPPIGSPGDMSKPPEVQEPAATPPGPAPYIPSSWADTTAHRCNACERKMKQVSVLFWGKQEQEVTRLFADKVVTDLCQHTSADSQTGACTKLIVSKTMSALLKAVRGPRGLYDGDRVGRDICVNMRHCP